MAYGHGKVILLGEHSVVHGQPALAMAVGRGCDVTVTAKGTESTSLHIDPWNVDVDVDDVPEESKKQLLQALQVACAMYVDDLEFSLHATMRLPSGAGMGSSAALGVAVLRALDEARDKKRSNEDLYERSLAWERVFHGNPSGVDNAMAVHGGVAMFKKGAPFTRIVPRTPIRVLAGDSGSPGNTKDMVASVARQFEKEPARIGKVFESIGAIVNNGKLALETGDLKGLGQLMDMNHMLLAGMMLSTDALEEMIKTAKNAGALGAKLTGAGGGGCMIALVDSDEAHAKVKAALEGLGKTVYEVESST